MEGLETITTTLVGVFTQVQGAGLKIVTGAIALGVVFVGAKWLWGKTRQWLSRV